MLISNTLAICHQIVKLVYIYYNLSSKLVDGKLRRRDNTISSFSWFCSVELAC